MPPGKSLKQPKRKQAPEKKPTMATKKSRGKPSRSDDEDDVSSRTGDGEEGGADIDKYQVAHEQELFRYKRLGTPSSIEEALRELGMYRSLGTPSSIAKRLPGSSGTCSGVNVGDGSGDGVDGIVKKFFPHSTGASAKEAVIRYTEIAIDDVAEKMRIVRKIKMGRHVCGTRDGERTWETKPHTFIGGTNALTPICTPAGSQAYEEWPQLDAKNVGNPAAIAGKIDLVSTSFLHAFVILKA